MHVLVLPVREQEVHPADTDIHQLGVVPLAGVEDALVPEVLALKSEKIVYDLKSSALKHTSCFIKLWFCQRMGKLPETSS